MTKQLHPVLMRHPFRVISLVLLATGTHAEGDGELLHGWWTGE